MAFTPCDLDAVLTKRRGIELYWVAYSGGLDSTVLLHAMHERYGGQRVKAIHINHGLHGNAASWARHCEQVCAKLGVELTVLLVNATAGPRVSPEDAARNARYAAIEPYIKRHTALLTAQHQDDQAETLLLQLLRGCGVDGLAAMPQVSQFGEGFLLRPLLGKSREELLDYAKQQALQWIEDSSNQNRRFHRNYLRADVMPLLKSRWPAYSRLLARSAQLQAEASELLAELAKIDMQSARANDSLSITALRGLTDARRRNVLRYWLKGNAIRPPSRAHLAQIERLLEAARDAVPVIKIANHEIRRYRDKLYCLSVQARTPTAPLFWDLKQPLYIPVSGKYLRFEDLPVHIKTYLNSCRKIEIRPRQGGESIQLKGHGHRSRVKKLLQEKAVPPWMRERLMLLYADDKLLAVLGLEPPLWAALSDVQPAP